MTDHANDHTEDQGEDDQPTKRDCKRCGRSACKDEEGFCFYCVEDDPV